MSRRYISVSGLVHVIWGQKKVVLTCGRLLVMMKAPRAATRLGPNSFLNRLRLIECQYWELVEDSNLCCNVKSSAMYSKGVNVVHDCGAHWLLRCRSRFASIRNSAASTKIMNTAIKSFKPSSCVKRSLRRPGCSCFSGKIVL